MKDDKILDVTEDVKWIGVLDKDIVTFDVVMETEYGTTYNSYFINADKKTIIETSKENFKDVYLNKVERVVDYEDIEYIVMNHTEPDHSSNLKYLLKLAPQATVVATRPALNFLKNMMDIEFKQMAVKHGDTLDLGNKTLKFIAAPFLHWPDTMYTYLEEDEILFTCDSFGSHFCDERMYDDEVADFDDAFKYYYDVILKPYSNHMLEAIDRIKDLKIKAICTGHGPILRTNWEKYVNWSKELAEETERNQKQLRVFMPYVTAYGNTEKIGKKIAEGIKSESDQIDVIFMDIEHALLGDLESEIYISDAFIIGSPTINQNILLPIYELFALINPVRHKGKLGGAFGSFGWSGEGVKMIQENLKNLKLKLYDDKGVKITFVPDENNDEAAIEYGKGFVKELLEMNNR